MPTVRPEILAGLAWVQTNHVDDCDVLESLRHGSIVWWQVSTQGECRGGRHGVRAGGYREEYLPWEGTAQPQEATYSRRMKGAKDIGVGV